MADPILTTNPSQPMTQEQLAALLATMPDIGGQSAELARQQAISQRLRGDSAGNGRMDFASQGARAIGGLNEGMQYNREKAASDEMMRSRKEMAEVIKRALGGGGGGMVGNQSLGEGGGYIPQMGE